ncbi:suppressor of fused domain protein [Bacillus sp. NP157]|nr:suppressor of fused domain protein [Bacillus sp. NP157]
MGKLWNKLRSALGKNGDGSPSAATTPAVDPAEARWQEVYAARARFYEDHVGPLPDDILKIGHMFGVWPGGGLFVIPAERLAPGAWAYTTFGFTNPDMPTEVAASNVAVNHDDQGRVTQSSAALVAKVRAEAPEGSAGYGYELLVLARENAQWPLWILQWAAQAELAGDAGILARVRQYDGLTVESVRIGTHDYGHLLFSKAVLPLPDGVALPNGRMELIVATVITEEEMLWSKEHGRGALLDRLVAAGVGQFSERARASVI